MIPTQKILYPRLPLHEKNSDIFCLWYMGVKRYIFCTVYVYNYRSFNASFIIILIKLYLVI